MLLSKAKQVVCVSRTAERFKFANPDLCILENASVAVSAAGIIEEIGDIDEKYQNYQKIDCRERCVIPGLVDAHTHMCMAGDRSDEFEMKLQGATYMEIHNKGGGIMKTSRYVNKSTQEELEQIIEQNLKRVIRNGTTTVEIKSGFGLGADGEAKQLQAIHAVSQRSPIEIVATYLGAHALPPGMTEKEAEKDVIENQIPLIQSLKQQGKINPEFVDVFCEKGIYELESTKNILQAGQKIGLIAAFHGEELNHLESGKLGADIGAISISHLEHLSQEGIKAMAEKQVVGIVLPTTQFILKLQAPPVRQMLDSGVPTALATDFCPNAFCISLPFTMSLACLNCKMMPSEALAAVTLNAAAALNRHKTVGSIEVGKLGDFVILDAPTWVHLIYQISDSPIWKVIKKGKVIYEQH